MELQEIQEWLKSEGEKPFRAKQLFEWLYKKRISSFDEMSNVSKSLREKLEKSFEFTTLKQVAVQESSDGTAKFLFELYDGNLIETVLMKHDYGYSVCVTTQVGCRIGCTFCASSLMGLKRNLEAGEIVAQIMKVQQKLDETDERISSVVVMGIGEPFDNYDHVMSFIKIINNDCGINIGARHITVSTSGVVPKIYEFANEGWQVSFAISLHATTNELRTKLMPINKAYPIEELLKAVEYYVEKTGRRVTFEFGLINGENDHVEEAERLAKLVKHIKCHINLIPINYVSERDKKRTTSENVSRFEKVLKGHGINTTVRREKGHDIDAACGQLRAQYTE